MSGQGSCERGGARGGAPVQVSEPVNLPLAPHVNVALDVPPAQPGSHVALHDCPVVSVQLQPEVCGGEGAVPLHWLAVAQVAPSHPAAQSHVWALPPFWQVPPFSQSLWLSHGGSVQVDPPHSPAQLQVPPLVQVPPCLQSLCMNPPVQSCA